MALRFERIEADTSAACALDIIPTGPAHDRRGPADNSDGRPDGSPGRARPARRTATVASGTLPPALFHLARTATPITLREAADAMRREADLLDFHADQMESEARRTEARRQNRVAFAEALDAMRGAVAEGIDPEIAVASIAAARGIDPMAILRAHRADTRKSTKSERHERDAAIWRLYCRGYTDTQLARRARLSPSRVREIISAQRKIHQP